jgi:hypothetical protein
MDEEVVMVPDDAGIGNMNDMDKIPLAEAPTNFEQANKPLMTSTFLLHQPMLPTPLYPQR